MTILAKIHLLLLSIRIYTYFKKIFTYVIDDQNEAASTARGDDETH